MFLAADRILQKRWAVKFFAHSRKTEDEIRILRLLDHPMIPRIVEYVEAREVTGVVMDYVEGVDLAEICRTGRLFSADRTAEIGIAVCDVLQYLHTMDPPLIYRDLKPQNLMMTEDGSIRLIDFECACPVDDQIHYAFAGTHGYAAPEQYGGICGPWTDLYTLGVVLSVISVKKCPRKLTRILKKCTKTDPRRRWQSAEELKKALEAFRQSEKTKKRNTVLAAISFLLLLFLPLLQFAGSADDETACAQALLEGDYEKAAALFPDREEIYLSLLEEGTAAGRTEEAIASVSSLRALYPSETAGHYEVCLMIGSLYLTGNPLDEAFATDYETAGVWFQNIPSEDCPETVWFLDLIDMLIRTGDEIDWEQAAASLKSLEAEIGAYGDRAVFCEVLSSVWMTNRYYLEECGEDALSESISLLEEAAGLLNEEESRKSLHLVTVESSLAQACYLAGLSGGDSGMLERARELYEELAQESLITQEARSRTLQRLAYICEELSEYSQAAEVYETLLEEYPDDIENYVSYALMELLCREDIEHAEELCEMAGNLSDADENQNYQILKERLEGFL